MKTEREMTLELHNAAHRIVKLRKLIEEERASIVLSYVDHLDKNRSNFDEFHIASIERAINDTAVIGEIYREAGQIVLSAHRSRLARNVVLGKGEIAPLLATMAEEEARGAWVPA